MSIEAGAVIEVGQLVALSTNRPSGIDLMTMTKAQLIAFMEEVRLHVHHPRANLVLNARSLSKPQIVQVILDGWDNLVRAHAGRGGDDASSSSDGATHVPLSEASDDGSSSCAGTSDSEDEEDEKTTLAHLLGLEDGEVLDAEMSADGDNVVFDKDYLEDPSDFNKVSIKVFHFDRHLFTTKAFLTDTVDKFKQHIVSIFDVKAPKNAENRLTMDSFNLCANADNVVMKSYMVLGGYFEGHCEPFQVGMRLVLKGGGLVRKTVTKTEALKALKDKSAKNTQKEITFDESISFPETLQNFLNQERSKIDQIKVLHAQNVPVVKLGLKGASTELLNKLKDVMTIKRGQRRGSSEERALKAMDLLFPSLPLLENSAKKIEHEQQCMTQSMMGIYLDTYHSFNGNECKFNNEKFLADIDITLEERNPTNNQPEGANCTIS